MTEYKIPNDYSEQTLVEALGASISLIKDQIITQRFVLFDTFDWRLFDESLLLYKSNNELVLQSISSQSVLHRQPIDNLPKFVWDFPEGSLKQQLEPIVEMRALLKATEADLYTAPYRMLNKDEKTVVRLVYETIDIKQQADSGPVATRLVVNPVRGYNKAAKKLAQHLNSLGLEAEAENFLVKALEAEETSPADFLAGLKVSLEPQMRADEATKLILQSALREMKLNEDGIKKDIDTEFLHDFRVAVRRTRSVLSQVKSVFPDDVTARFKVDFATIGKATNELRDLDVYLLAEDNFKAMMPTTMQGDIDPLFNHLQKSRGAALKTVVRMLNGAHYAETLTAWEQFLGEPIREGLTTKNGRTPIKTLAQNRIYKKYQGIIKWGNQILQHTEDEALHDLRLECKKLRYLLEFFKSVFPRKKITLLIKQLKKLQTNLGDFTDLCVQEEYLLTMTDQLPLSGAKARKVFVAVGCLVGGIQQEQQRVKAEFAQAFTEFATPENQALFRELFVVRKEAKSA